MKTGSPIRFWAVGLLLCAAVQGPATTRANAQNDQTQSAQLLGKAHALEVRGRMDMAKQTWQQVLLVDPNNSEALAGMARAAKLEGKSEEASRYLEKMRALNPSDPNISRVEGMSTQQNTSTQLREAGKLAQAGQYARAMSNLRQVYGDTPPPGDGALSYYQTEAATEDGRPHAIAGLRALVDKYPQDSRYQIALGKILTYNPRTRAEGRKLLERHPANPEATEALRQSLLWDAQSPATSADIRNYLSKHKDQALSTALAQTQAQAAAGRRAGGPKGPPQTPEQLAAAAAFRARSAEDQAAYNALNAKHIDEAETRFKAILANNATDTQALAGLGYVRMQQSNFGGAISYLQQAENDGAKDPAIEKALRDSRFYYTMQEATAALNENDLVTAQKQFQSALTQRANDPEALLGLGGTMLKAQQPEPAIGVFSAYVKVRPGDKAAWRGLFMSEYGSGKYNDALAVDKRVPPPVRAQLLRDPDYLRTLASVYSALGRDADAQRVLRSALDLPFPAGAKGLKADTQLQYASLLAAANHKEQAAGLYRQVLAADPGNTNAWAGLVQIQHSQGQDAEALQTLQTMPPASYASAMQEPGFETTVAAIYEGQGKYDLAQDVLEKFLDKQRQEGKKPFVPAQVQLAGLYLQRGNSQLAFPLYQAILTANPERPDAWRGLLSALHNTGHDQEALAQLQQMPPAVRKDLENDPAYLQTVGSIYAGLGQPQEAMVFFNRVKQHYIAQHIAPPADIDIQNSWLLYNSHNDAALYPSLMALGGRQDLTDQQRRTVQTIWANWSVRRANQAADAGYTKRSLAILNAAAQSFPDNPDVTKALASGYARAGLPKQAVNIFKAQDLTTGSAADYKAAIGAALADNDLRDAETWLRFGLDQYPQDAQMLLLAAKFETARGDSNRAAAYYRASLKAMPPPDAGAELASELSRVPAVAPVRRTSPAAAQPQDLATLLATPEATAPAATAPQQPAYTRPYLPGSANYPSSAPVIFGGPGYGATGSGLPANSGSDPVYNYNSVPTTTGRPQKKSTVPQNSTLKDYVPQAQMEQGTGQSILVLHPVAAMEAAYGPYKSYDPSVGMPAMAGMEAPAAGESYLHNVVFQQTITQDGTPIVPYASTAKPTHNRTPNASAKSRAAAIRANQAAAPETMSGVSRPPSDNYAVQLDSAQYTTPAYSTTQQQGSVVQQQTTGVQTPSQSGDSNGQQYPQPNTRGATTTQRSTGAPASRTHRRRASAPPEPQASQEPVATTPALTYPTYGQPLSNPGLPRVGAPYPLGNAPTDQQLILRNVPPLRSSYDPRIDPRTPLTERQDAQFQLAALEGSYSGWLGASVIGRYRSGTPGIDRLSALEVPVEASVVLNNALRLTVIPKAVFLNSGALNTNSGTLGTNPVLGSLPGNATFSPQQQFASGVGGEFQISTNTISAAIGYTPYEFLVSNVIGRVRWKPGNGRFTLYGGRDAVTETQLSYAGLRDPGSATTTFSGNVWGGVVQTGGGIRYDQGDEKAGLYILGEGAALTGYHVLDNRKYDGTVGAYFRVRTWPEYGSLNVGGTLFGEHYDHNERGETYGLGGYFSPEAYFLAAVPVTFNGHYGTNLHYVINGSVGLQTFQEDNQIYFPLNPALQSAFSAGCTTVTNSSCGQSPVNSNTGLNYAINAQAAYQVDEHWFVGGFLTGNNTNNYNTVSGGFYGRYVFRPQYPTTDYPTGLFPIESTVFRPLRVP